MTYSIYKITNKVTDRVYIGKTCNTTCRFRHHLSTLRGGKHFIGMGWEAAGNLEKTLIREAGDPYNRLSNPNYVHHCTIRAALRRAQIN
jgi:hypothetical protein